MNPRRGWLSPDILRLPVFLLSLRRGGRTPAMFLAAILCPVLIASSPVHAELRRPQALQADVLPGGRLPGQKDLDLTPDARAHAGALAAFSRAIIAEDGADGDKALEEYQKALALDPGYSELAVKVAFELARRGDAPSGIQVLKDAIKASPRAPLPYLYLSQLYAHYISKPELGLKYAQQALDLDPTNFASYLAVYQICKMTNQPGKAVEVLDRAAAQKSGDPQYWIQLGEFYRQVLDDAHAPGDEKKLEAIYGKALDCGGEDPLVLARVAEFFANHHKAGAAIPLYLKAIRVSPANPPEGDDLLPRVRYSLAQCYVATQHKEEAVATLKQLIRDDPVRYEPYALLCQLYTDAAQYDAAQAVCQQMMLLKPDDHENYIRSSYLLVKQGKPNAAVQLLTEARVKFPTQAPVTYALGEALNTTRQYHEAVTVFEEAVQEASSGQTAMLDADFYYAYASAAEGSGELDKAARLVKKAIDLNPRDAAEGYNFLGYMWIDRGMKLDEAGALVRKALLAEPDNPAYIDSMGWYHYKKGEYRQAVEMLQRAVNLLTPEDATVDEHLGDACWGGGDSTHALEYWERALALDKDNKQLAAKVAGGRKAIGKK